MRNMYKIFIGKSEGKQPCRRLRHRCEDEIRMDLRQIGWEDMNWIHLAEDRDQWWALRNMIMNLQVSDY